MIPVSEGQIREFTRKGWWGKETLVDLLFRNAAATPDAEAVADPYNRPALIGGEAKRLTYSQTVRCIDRLAIHFERLGIKKDDVVLVQLPNVVDALLVYLCHRKNGRHFEPPGHGGPGPGDGACHKDDGCGRHHYRQGVRRIRSMETCRWFQESKLRASGISYWPGTSWTKSASSLEEMLSDDVESGRDPDDLSEQAIGSE